MAAGARRVGWKIGRGIVEGEEHLEPVIGYLSSETLLAPGSQFDGRGTRDPRVDAELALEIGTDGAVAGYGCALELVDVARPPYDFESIVAANIWHRGVAFGPLRPDLPTAEPEAAVLVNGKERESASFRENSAETVRIAEALLTAIGERLEPGDRIICGSLVHVPVARGNAVAVGIGGLGRVEVEIS